MATITYNNGAIIYQPIYIASPYSGPVEVCQKRYDEIVEVCKAAYIARIPIYCPIATWHPIALQHDLPKEYNAWVDQDEAMILVSRKVLVICLDGWKQSAGINHEVAFAEQHHILIDYWGYSTAIKPESWQLRYA